MPYCQKCGCLIPEANIFCNQCGHAVNSNPPPASETLTSPLSSSDPNETIRFFVPYTNPYGVISYYLGLSALLPFLGIPLGIAAVILGMIGLVKAQKNPHIRGKYHAWAGIILGELFASFYLILFWVMFYGINTLNP